MIVLYIIGGFVGIVIAGIVLFLLVIVAFDLILGLINNPNFMDF
jgi:hypothetical protein